MADMAIRLGRVCRRAREHADLRAIDIATSAGVSETTISRFEAGTRWVDQVEEVVAAYEREIGLEPLELWKRAVNE